MVWASGAGDEAQAASRLAACAQKNAAGLHQAATGFAIRLSSEKAWSVGPFCRSD